MDERQYYQPNHDAGNFYVTTIQKWDIIIKKKELKVILKQYMWYVTDLVAYKIFWNYN